MKPDANKFIFDAAKIGADGHPLPAQPDNGSATASISNRADGDSNPLEEMHGEALHTSKTENGGVAVNSFNQCYWSAVMTSENRILHEAMERCFYLYSPDCGLWREATDDALVNMFCERLKAHAATLPELQKQIIRLITHNRAKQVIEMMRGMAEVRNAFDNRPRAIHVANGMIRFTGGEPSFESFSPDYFSRNQSPIAYDPNAECPRFINELLVPALDDNDISLFQRWMGVTLYGINLPQRILLLDGMPNGGKSTLAEIVKHIIGAENCYQLRTACLTGQFETYRFRRKTLLAGVDVPGDFLEQKGATVLKALVGGDTHSCEQKGGNGDFSIKGNFNVIITSNSRLRARLEGDVDAWRRRLMIVRYNRPPVKKRILGFDEMLVRDEGGGILRWALDGFKIALKEFSETGDFKLTNEQQGRVDNLLAESDSVNWFLRDCVEACAGEDITSAELVELYAEYCSSKGWTALPQTVITNQFNDLMLSLFHTAKANSIVRNEKAQRGWRRVRIKKEFAL
jgi:P4 family phage/plasmid primase-like protien